MNLIEFSIKLGSITSKSGIKAAICDFITNHSIEYNKDKIKEHISNLSIEAFTSYGNNLGICRNYCLEEKSEKLIILLSHFWSGFFQRAFDRLTFK